MAELQAEIDRLKTELANAPTVPAQEPTDLEKIRDQVLKNWRVKSGPEKKDRIAEALDKFIKAIRDQGDKLEE